MYDNRIKYTELETLSLNLSYAVLNEVIYRTTWWLNCEVNILISKTESYMKNQLLTKL